MQPTWKNLTGAALLLAATISLFLASQAGSAAATAIVSQSTSTPIAFPTPLLTTAIPARYPSQLTNTPIAFPTPAPDPNYFRWPWTGDTSRELSQFRPNIWHGGDGTRNGIDFAVWGIEGRDLAVLSMASGRVITYCENSVQDLNPGPELWRNVAQVVVEHNTGALADGNLNQSRELWYLHLNADTVPHWITQTSSSYHPGVLPGTYLGDMAPGGWRDDECNQHTAPEHGTPQYRTNAHLHLDVDSSDYQQGITIDNWRLPYTALGGSFTNVHNDAEHYEPGSVIPSSTHRIDCDANGHDATTFIGSTFCLRSTIVRTPHRISFYLQPGDVDPAGTVQPRSIGQTATDGVPSSPHVVDETIWWRVAFNQNSLAACRRETPQAGILPAHSRTADEAIAARRIACNISQVALRRLG